ncbi:MULTISPECIES: tetratricopeptide repeat protein [Chryseobacterium]|uniref:transcriptional regulator n=1 Tax=Chryseobacterium TaxID=59732 RepID=UPI001295E91C|nr:MULTISPECIES: tetratricopeptide repeat protein [Chryseobacterium]MDR6919700.1 tetratricopeptide (TPR) repeat protein [Chryseobacterium sp. 2987]
MIEKKIFYIFLLIPVLLFSQTPQKKIPEIEQLLDSSYIKTMEFDVQTGIFYAKKALDISKKKNYSRGIAIGNFRIGQCLTELNTYKQGLEYLDKAQQENKNLNDTSLNFEIRRVRARIYASSKLYTNAVAENKKALAIIPEMKRSEEDKNLARALIYENLANTYGFMKKQDSVYFYLNSGMKVLRKLDVKKSMISIINNYTRLADYYLSIDKAEEAEYFLVKAVNFAKANGYPFLSFTFRTYGDLMLYHKKNDSALFYYNKALQISEQTKLKSELPAIYLKIANVSQLLGNTVSEEKYRLKSFELTDSLRSEALAASNMAVNSILSDQREEFVKENKKHQSYLIMIISITLLLFIGLWMLYKKKAKKLSTYKKVSTQKEQMLIQQKEEIAMRYEEDTRKLEQKVNESFDEVLFLAKNNSPEFFTRFQEVYPEVIRALLARDSKLRVSELALCAYFFLGFTTKDVALYTFKSINTVRNRRQNLRTKLQIPADEDLELWFKNLSKNQFQ